MMIDAPGYRTGKEKKAVKELRPQDDTNLRSQLMDLFGDEALA